MDFRAKFFCRTLFALFLIPTLIWGYGKAVFRIAQTSEDSSIDGVLDTSSSRPETSKSESSSTENLNSAAQAPNPENQVSEQGAEGSGSVIVQAGPSTVTGIAKTTENAEDPKNSGKSTADETAPAGINSKTEPELDPETYNQVRVRKPSIPNRFGADSANGQLKNQEPNGQPIPMMGLLGIPTLVFSLLFFVMWGIISGKIQRVMF